jgi:hypothetical protein
MSTAIKQIRKVATNAIPMQINRRRKYHSALWLGNPICDCGRLHPRRGESGGCLRGHNIAAAAGTFCWL